MPAKAPHHIVPVTDPSWPACACGAQPAAEAETRERVLATFAHVHGANLVDARATVSWHAAIDGGHAVPDLTGRTWPSTCAARAEFRREGEPVTFRAVCTRRTSHTGRHAAGAGDRVVAVWSGPRS